MSLCTGEFAALLDAQEDWCGERLKASVGDVTNNDAIVEALTLEQVIVAGGVAESGGFRLQMLESDFATLPAELAPATARGVTLSVLSVVRNNGILIFTIGDPIAQDRR